jgi:hypothetical protein
MLMTQRQPIKRVRPPMPPLAVRVQVAERQLPQDAYQAYVTYCLLTRAKLGKRLFWLLTYLFDKPELHHSPALILRPYNSRIKDIAARYSPNANSPDSLVYLEASDHLQRTTGRKPGAERTVTTKGSDIGLKSKFNRLEGRTKKRLKAQIPARKNPWPKRGFGK